MVLGLAYTAPRNTPLDVRMLPFPLCTAELTTVLPHKGIAESLEHEISPLGLRSVYLEPGYFRTSFLNSGNRSAYTSRIPDYAETINRTNDALLATNNNQPGDPKKFVQVLINFVRREGPFDGKKLPVGLPVGSDAFAVVKQAAEEVQGVLEEWEDVIKSTDL